MVLDTPAEFSTIFPEKRFIGSKNNIPPIIRKESKNVRIGLFKMEFILFKDKPYFSTNHIDVKKGDTYK